VSLAPGLRNEAKTDPRLARLWGHRTFETLVGLR
jgi:hypothetical protein